MLAGILIGVAGTVIGGLIVAAVIGAVPRLKVDDNRKRLCQRLFRQVGDELLESGEELPLLLRGEALPVAES